MQSTGGTMKYKCDTCELVFSKEANWQDHLAGRKHQLKLEKSTQLALLAQRSVYLNNFKHPICVEELTRELGQFGEVDKVVSDKSGKNAFAIVEFKEADAAQNLLHSIQRLKIGKSICRIQPRRVDFAGSDPTQLCNKTGVSAEHGHGQQQLMNSEMVLECIDKAGTGGGFSAQMDALINQFAITNEMASERAEFAQHLQRYLQRFFASPIQIRVFGSSATGLGFACSDLDLNMVFEEDLIRKEEDSSGQSSSIGSPAGQQDHDGHDDDAANFMMMDHDNDHGHDNHSELQQLTPETLAATPLETGAFVKLSKNDRIRLLNRLINAFRREQGLITAHVPVPDGRTPIVRFLLRIPNGSGQRLPCEMSVRNMLSECKANLVRDIVRAETTGRLWQLLFLLKLWASTNGLFSPETGSSAHHHHRPNPPKKTKKKAEAEAQSKEQSQQKEQQQQAQEHPKEAQQEQPKVQPQPQQHQQHPKAHWNSYTLALCTIAYLQQQQHKVIPPIGALIRPTSRKLGGWPIEYDLPFFALGGGDEKQHHQIPALLKGLFTFLYQQLKEDRVVSLHEGRMIEAKEFKQKHVDSADAQKCMAKLWRFSVVNVQDPLQRCHNVAANVSKDALAKLRWKVMYGISALKRTPQDLRGLFQIDSVEKLQEARWAEKQASSAGKGGGGSSGRTSQSGGANDGEEEEEMEVDHEQQEHKLEE